VAVWTRTPPRVAHAAFLYISDDAHVAHVVSFVGDGLHQGQRTLVCTTVTHWDDIGARLNTAGIEWVRATQRRDLMFVDAEHVLRETVIDGLFARARLDALVRRLVPDGPFQRCYGDAAGLLTGSGNLAAALSLEHVWQELARERDIDVSCGYDLRHVPHVDSQWPIRSVLNGHDRGHAEPGAWSGDLLEAADDRTAASAELILLWDDYADARDMYAEALTRRGYRVITAADGAQTLSLARAYGPDLVVIDVRRDDEGAASTTRELRAHHGFDGPVLALTAHALDHERDRIFGCDFNGVLTKPCLPETFAAAVSAALGSRRPTPPVAAD
jgi:CheY-like chemotaxis protein